MSNTLCYSIFVVKNAVRSFILFVLRTFQLFPTRNPTMPSRRDFIETTAAVAAAGAVASSKTQGSAGTPVASFGSASSVRVDAAFGAHVKTLTPLQLEGRPIELVSVCDVVQRKPRRAGEVHRKRYRSSRRRIRRLSRHDRERESWMPFASARPITGTPNKRSTRSTPGYTSTAKSR